MDAITNGGTASRKQTVSYYYHPEVGNYHYGPQHPMKPHRIRMTHNLIVNYGLQKKLEIHRPSPATFLELTKFHSDEYMDFLQRISPDNMDEMTKNMQKFNVGEDCPVFDGIYDFSSMAAGGTISAARQLNEGKADIAIHWGGGLHHAKKCEASGFCYVNDIVLGILELLRVHQRVLYVDIDVHHGDGVEEAFYCTDRVMTVSFHKYGEFFPGTGDVDDTGHGKGKRYALNFPLKEGIDDETYKAIFQPVMKHVMAWYRPDIVVLQCGADSLAGDRLGCFNLSMKGHAMAVGFMKTFDVPILMLGGGGYTIKNVSRAWCYETGIAVGVELSDEIPLNSYYPYYGPDFRLDVPNNTMENRNTKEYLERIYARILDNLRDVPFAPSVQMQEAPPALDLSHFDREDSPDTRISQSMSDRRRVSDNEYSDSEDEGDDRRDIRCYYAEDFLDQPIENPISAISGAGITARLFDISADVSAPSSPHFMDEDTSQSAQHENGIDESNPITPNGSSGTSSREDSPAIHATENEPEYPSENHELDDEQTQGYDNISGMDGVEAGNLLETGNLLQGTNNGGMEMDEFPTGR